MHTGHTRPQTSQRTRVQLNDYDESLLLDRSYVHHPQHGFVEVGEDADVLEERFGPIRTSWAVCLYLVCIAAYLAFLLFNVPSLPEVDAFPIKASAHIIILVLAMLLESFLRLNHRRRQQLGYLRFYRNTRHLLSVPFYAAAVATAALLLVELWPETAAWLPQHHKLVIITSLECSAVVIFTVLYVTRVQRHNRTEAVPDAQRYLQSALYTAPDTGLRQQDAVVEQQGEVIRFLQRRCDNLAREVLHLQAREDSHYMDDKQGETAVHLEHLLATREQELRALLAEKESLHSQNRQTWNLLEERTNENSQLQLVKQQHMEENSRLRATLEEWSHSNAKLEQRLNKHKLRNEELQAQLQDAKARGHTGQSFSAEKDEVKEQSPLAKRSV